MNLLDINNLKKEDIYRIWEGISGGVPEKQQGNIAWSFEGNGIRTRTTFIQAFQRLGLSYIELPNFLKTDESVQDLAGYMDPFYSMYIIRDNDHKRMVEFARSTERPVINAMSSEAHPCEVLTDAYYLESKYDSLQQLSILLWGPLTNVFKSWHSLAEVLGLKITHFCPKEQRRTNDAVIYPESPNGQYDVVVTDAWPGDFSDEEYALSLNKLLELGNPEMLPTPPVTVGEEILFSPSHYDKFSGYAQKRLLLPAQEAIIAHLLRS